MNSKLALTTIVMVAAIMGIGSVAPAAFADHKESHNPLGLSKDEGCGAKWSLVPVDSENPDHVAADENLDGMVCIKTNPAGKNLVVDNEVEEEEPEIPEEV